MAKRVEVGRSVSARQRKPRWDAGLGKIAEVARWALDVGNPKFEIIQINENRPTKQPRRVEVGRRVQR